MVRVGRFASFIVLLLAAVISPIVGRYGIFMFFQFTLTAIAIPFVATVLLGVLWKRVNYPAALFGLLGGVAITVFYMVIFSGKFTESGIPALHFFYIGGIAEVTTMIGIAVVSLATAPPDYEKIAPFVWRPQLLRTYDEGVRRPWWQTLKFWFGVVTVIWLYLYWRFW
jgi:Na+/proline symporter